MRTLLRMRLLHIPVYTFKLPEAMPDESGLRLGGFQAWYSLDTTPVRLRSVCMSLELTDIAMNISAKKTDAWLLSQGVEPTLARLGRGEVQSRASERLQALLGAIR